MEKVSMWRVQGLEKCKNVVSKMSMAAKKAWETRRKNKQAAGSSSVRKNERKEKEKTVKEVSNESNVGFKADEKKEMMALNGIEVENLAKQTQKHLDRKAAFDEAKNGKKDVRAISVGKLIKKAKVERFNGGIKLS